MSRVNVDAQAFVDSRFARLAHEMGWGDPDFAIGKMARLWLECTVRETETLMGYEVGFAWRCDGTKAAEALVASGLADEAYHDEGGEVCLRIKGCAGRIEWLAKLRKNGKYGKLGGRPKGSKNKPTRVSGDNPDGSKIKTPPAPAPAPAPAPKEREGGHDASASALALAAISELNRLTGRSFSPDAKPTIADAKKLAKLGYTPEQAADVVCAKHREWARDPKMSKQLKPSVLLRPSNFEKYLAEDVNASTGKRLTAGQRLALANQQEAM